MIRSVLSLWKVVSLLVTLLLWKRSLLLISTFCFPLNFLRKILSFQQQTCVHVIKAKVRSLNILFQSHTHLWTSIQLSSETLYNKAFPFTSFSLLWTICHHLRLEERRGHSSQKSFAHHSQRISHSEPNDSLWSQRELERFVQ